MICEFWALTQAEVMNISKMDEDEFLDDYLENHLADTDIDKAWDGLDYLMHQDREGDDFPLGFFHKGTPLGILVGNLGEGDPGIRWYNAEETAEIARFLDSFDRETLHKHYVPEKMEQAEIYPDIWVREKEEAFEYLYHYFTAIRDFFRKTADDELCTLLSLS